MMRASLPNSDTASARLRRGERNSSRERAGGLPRKLESAGNETALQPLKREALRDQVVRAIRDAIIQGKLRPGEKVPEGDLAQQLTVSRTPIREAIRVLEGQGLVG